MISKTSELIQTLYADSSLKLFWQAGSKPSAPGSYWIDKIRVSSTAVNGAMKIDALKCVKSSWNNCVYRLKMKIRIEMNIANGDV